MRWSEEHDLAFVREILLFEPFKYPNGSSERGQAWQFVADSLNQMDGAPNSSSSIKFSAVTIKIAFLSSIKFAMIK